MHLFCFGLGYSALTLAEQLLGEVWRVSGTCRSEDKCDALRVKGITAYIFDNDLPLQHIPLAHEELGKKTSAFSPPEAIESLKYRHIPADSIASGDKKSSLLTQLFMRERYIWDLQTVTHILHSVPPNDNGDPVFLQHYQDLQNLPELKWFGYLSTVGVYGDHKGAWVDERTSVSPAGLSARNQRRINAENAWLQSSLPVHVFRLAGIYGKERNVINELIAGKAHRIHKEGQVFSRIHVEDIAQILRASINNPRIHSIYNCADNHPEAQKLVVEYAAELLGIAPPPLVDLKDANLSEMARSFWANNRRIDNGLIKNELQVKLKYPSYKEGLSAINLKASS
jgi:hypothetical protein